MRVSVRRPNVRQSQVTHDPIAEGVHVLSEQDGVRLVLYKTQLTAKLNGSVPIAASDSSAADGGTRQLQELTTPDFGIQMHAELQMGPEGRDDSLPVLYMHGRASASSATSQGHLHVTYTSEASWTPLPQHLPQLVVPRLRGNMTWHSVGQLTAGVTTRDMLPEVDALANVQGGEGQLLFLQGWQMAAALSATSSEATLRIVASGDVRIGGPGGFQARVSGSIDMSNSSTGRLDIVHLASPPWRPFPDVLPELTAPPFSGYMQFAPTPRMCPDHACTHTHTWCYMHCLSTLLLHIEPAHL